MRVRVVVMDLVLNTDGDLVCGGGLLHSGVVMLVVGMTGVAGVAGVAGVTGVTRVSVWTTVWGRGDGDTLLRILWRRLRL